MLRLLILIFFAYIAYRLVRKYIAAPTQNRESSAEGGAIDEMVQDPACKTYIPKRTALKRVVAGREYFFCSRECAEKFEREMERD